MARKILKACDFPGSKSSVRHLFLGEEHGPKFWNENLLEDRLSYLLERGRKRKPKIKMNGLVCATLPDIYQFISFP